MAGVANAERGWLMGVLDRVSRALLPWPDTATEVPAIAALSQRKERATWPRLVQNPLGPVAGAFDDWSGPTWTNLVADGDDALALSGLTYADLYRSQPWVYITINKLARGIGRLPLKSYGTDDKGGRFRLRDAALATLLDRVAPRVTPSAFKQRIVGDLATHGNALYLKIARSATSVPTSLEPVPPVGWRVTGSGDYEWTSPRTGERKTYDAWRIMHFRFWSPDDGNGFACAPLEPLRRTLAIEDAAQRLGIAAFRHGGNRPGFLTTDQQVPQAEREVLTQQWAQRHGGVDNAYRTPVLTGGLHWEGTGGTLAESAVVEHRRLTREEVCAVYDIPPPIVGILDRATFSNISEQARWLVQHTYSPWATLIEETLAAHLLDGVPDFRGQFVEFDYAEVLRGDLPSRYTAYGQAVNAGFLTQNEIRRLENYPPVTDDPDADRLHRPLSLSPAEPKPEPVAGGLNGQ
jgi:HK97 family phage portal protein